MKIPRPKACRFCWECDTDKLKKEKRKKLGKEYRFTMNLCKKCYTEKENKRRLLKWRNHEKDKEYASKNLLRRRIHNNLRRERMRVTNDWTINVDSINSLLVKQSSTCNICSKSIKEKFDMDHIIPLSKSWPHSIYNIQLLCPHCNRSKHNRYDPIS